MVEMEEALYARRTWGGLPGVCVALWTNIYFRGAPGWSTVFLLFTETDEVFT